MGHTALRQNGKSLDKLSDKMRRFALEYPLDYNGKAAVIRAGYSPKAAAVTASKLLKHPVIKAYLGKQERLLAEKLEVDTEEILKQLCYAATRKVSDFVGKDGEYLSPNDLPEQCQSIVDGLVITEVTRTDKDGNTTVERKYDYKWTPHAVAREQVLKYKGMFMPEKHEHKVVVMDWDSLVKPPKDADAIEQRLALEEQKGAEDGA